MKIAVISDVHANLQALEAVLAVIETNGADAVVCLGDTVGYGPDAIECVRLVRERCAVVVRGNHDDAVSLGAGIDDLPSAARAAVALHRKLLSEDDLAWLAGLPLVDEAFDCTFAHATPGEPALWRRTDSYTLVQEQFRHFSTEVCFVGHTHVPAVASDRVGVLRLRKGHRVLVNVGSVGQPRDGDPRAAFGLFDTEAFSLDVQRVPYDVTLAAQRVKEAGLPESQARRLRRGR